MLVRDENHWLRQGAVFLTKLCQNISSAKLKPSVVASLSLSLVEGNAEGACSWYGFYQALN